MPRGKQCPAVEGAEAKGRDSELWRHLRRCARQTEGQGKGSGAETAAVSQGAAGVSKGGEGLHGQDLHVEAGGLGQGRPSRRLWVGRSSHHARPRGGVVPPVLAHPPCQRPLSSSSRSWLSPSQPWHEPHQGPRCCSEFQASSVDRGRLHPQRRGPRTPETVCVCVCVCVCV